MLYRPVTEVDSTEDTIDRQEWILPSNLVQATNQSAQPTRTVCFSAASIVSSHHESIRPTQKTDSSDLSAKRCNETKFLFESQSTESQSTEISCRAEGDSLTIEAEPTDSLTMDILASETGIDYTQLRDLLAAGNWREADQENYRVMIRAVGKEVGDYFTRDALLNLPCTDLKTIDSLWVKYSKGHFSFSVQKEIYVECGASLDGNYPGDNIWDQFCDRVGWKIQGDYISYSNLKANLSTSPKGEFPGGMGDGLVGGWGWIVASIISKLADCEIRSF